MPRLVVVLLAGAALIAIALLWRPTPRRPTATAVPAGAIAATAEPRAAVQPARPQQPPPAAEPAAAVPPKAPAAAPAPPPPPNPFTVQYAAMLEQRFQRDHTAPNNAQLEQDLRAKITAAMPRASHLTSLECRRALCRVRSSHPDESTYQDYLGHVFLGQDQTSRVWPAQVWVAVPADTTSSPVTSSVYLGLSEELPP